MCFKHSEALTAVFCDFYLYLLLPEEGFVTKQLACSVVEQTIIGLLEPMAGNPFPHPFSSCLGENNTWLTMLCHSHCEPLMFNAPMLLVLLP